VSKLPEKWWQEIQRDEEKVIVTVTLILGVREVDWLERTAKKSEVEPDCVLACEAAVAIRRRLLAESRAGTPPAPIPAAPAPVAERELAEVAP